MTYQVDNVAWYAALTSHEVQVPCPICAGTKQVTLILGSGEARVLPCEFCDHGYRGPRGYLVEYAYAPEPYIVQVKEVRERLERQANPDDAEDDDYYVKVTEYVVRVSNGQQYIVRDADLCATPDAAIARGLERAAAAAAEQVAERQIKAKAHKSYSWNAGYHLREAEEYRKKAAYHDEMCRLCQEKAR